MVHYHYRYVMRADYQYIQKPGSCVSLHATQALMQDTQHYSEALQLNLHNRLPLYNG